MRNLIMISILSVLAVVIGGCSTGKSFARQDYDFSRINRVAVIDVEGSIMSEAARNQIGDFYVMELLRKGYAPIERAKVQKLLEEQQFQSSDMTSAEGVARAGRILNVPAVLMVSAPEFGTKIALTAKIVDVEDGSILWMGSGSGDTGGIFSTIGGAAAGAMAGAAVKDDSDAAAIGGAIVGGAAGSMLAPEKAELAQRIVEKMCESMPYKNVTPKKGWFE